MRIPFVSRKAYEQKVLELESLNVCLAKQNEGLCERVRRLEAENASVKTANRSRLNDIARLTDIVENMGQELNRTRKELKKERLMRGSMEAKWSGRAGSEI